MSPSDYVVRVFGTSSTGQGFNGTGFFVDKNGLVATCYHVANPGGEPPANLLIKGPYGQSLECQLVKFDNVHDLALIKPVLPIGKETSFAQLDGSWRNTTQSGDKVDIWGYSSPYFDLPQLFRSSVSGFSGPYAKIGLDANVNAGDSGGPVLNSKGLVIGVTQLRDPDRAGQAMAIPVSHLAELLKPKPIPPIPIPWLVFLGLGVVLALLITGAGVYFTLRVPNDYFEVHRTGAGGRTGPMKPWFSQSNLWHIEQWPPPENDSKFLVLKGAGLAMPGDLGTSVFKNFTADYNFAHFVEGSSIGWLVWVWPQDGRSQPKGNLLDASAKWRAYKITLKRDKSRLGSIPIQLDAKFCKAPNSCTPIPGVSPAPPLSCIADTLSDAIVEANASLIRVTVHLGVAVSTGGSIGEPCAYSHGFELSVSGGRSSVYGNIALFGLSSNDSKTDATLASLLVTQFRGGGAPK